MFNPVEVKGGAVFREIARALPDREFAVVPGWHSLRDASGDFDRATIRRSWESQGIFKEGRAGVAARVARRLRRVLVRLGLSRPVVEIEYPAEVDLSDLPNVTVLEPRAEVGEIYAQTRILLVPSQWEETFGRVAIEAFANGIPVIGSSVGGLKEHVGEAGLLVENKRDVGSWVRAIEELDAPERYEALRARGVAFVEQGYRLEETASRFASVLERVGARWRRSPGPATAAEPRIRILIPYFGAWPPWMGLFLESCRANPSIDWLLLGDCGPLDADLPPNVRVERWVAHTDLLPLTDVMVTTGGGGTVLAGLQAGVPMVIVPTQWEKPDIAQRVVEAGVGLRLEPGYCTPQRLRATVERTLSEGSFRLNSRRMAAAFAEYGGAPQAASFIEELHRR
jgi:hypothetical protein